MLPPFHVRNLQSPLDPVRIAAPCYDETLSSEPRATLKYKDDDGDSITIGSSLELEQCLGDRTSLAQRRQLAELQKSPASTTEAKSLHIFSIDGDERIQRIWHTMRERSKSQIAMTVKDVAVAAQTEDKARKIGIVQDSPHAAPINKSFDSDCGLKFGDYRAHYFNTTNPTQLCVPEKPLDLVNGNVLKAGVSEDSHAYSLNQADVVVKEQATSQKQEHKQHFVTANLTLEGKRQAQLAGEKFRARGLYYRPRKISTGPSDRLNYYNRWAAYNSAEKPEVVRAVITPDAKRQAQTAGDCLRSKTTRMRHVVKAVPKGGINPEQSCDRVSNDRQSPCLAQPKETFNVGSDSQMTLLELFESELARKPRPSAGQTEQSPLVSQNLPSASLMPRVNQSANSVALTRCDASSQTHSEVIENRIKTAVTGFELCLRGIIDTLKLVQPSKPDKEILAESSHFFQDFANKNFLSEELPLHRDDQSLVHKEKTKTEHIKTVEVPEASLSSESSPARIHDVGERQEPAEKQEQPEIWHPIPHEAADGQLQRSSLSFENSRSDRCTDLTGPFHYHQPGPIHLPQNDAWMQTSTKTKESVPKGSDSFEDQQYLYPIATSRDSAKPHLQQYRDSFRGGHSDRSYSPIAATTRFPTIGQFEKSTLLATTTPPFFPTLIDLNAEEGLRPPQPAKFANKDDKFEEIADVAGRTSRLPTPQVVAQLDPENELETRIDQSSKNLPGLPGDSLTSHASLSRPFDALGNPGTFSDRLVRGTDAYPSATNAKQFRTLRRPYSEFSSRDGRLGWNTAIGQQDQYSVNRISDAQASSTSLPLTTSGMLPPKRPEKSLVTSSGIRRSTTTTESRSQRRTGQTPRHSTSNIVCSQDAKIRKCVDQLTGLGFDIERKRLRVYASVADGDLDEAIDIITEDQKGHDNWVS